MQIADDVPTLRPWVRRLLAGSPPWAQRLQVVDRLSQLDTPASALAAGAMFERLVSMASFALVDGYSQGLALHAACVARDDVCVIIAGASGAGKTTATAWFLARGYHYVTDELVFVPNHAAHVQGWGRPLHVKNGSLAWVQSQQRFDDAPMLRYPGGAFVPAQNFGAATLQHVLPTHLMLVHHHATAPCEAVALRPAQAATHLVRHVLNARHLTAHGVPALIALCRRLRAVAWRYDHVAHMAPHLPA